MLKFLRKKNQLTQKECAEYLKVSLRTYQNYEKQGVNTNSLKYLYMLERLEKYGYIDEEHGVLTVEKIREACQEVFSKLPVKYCYLFGSYAKGKATEKSDVDLLVATELTGLKFFAMVEQIREKLKKKVDMLSKEQIQNNIELVDEILQSGVKVYG